MNKQFSSPQFTFFCFEIQSTEPHNEITINESLIIIRFQLKMWKHYYCQHSFNVIRIVGSKVITTAGFYWNASLLNWHRKVLIDKGLWMNLNIRKKLKITFSKITEYNEILHWPGVSNSMWFEGHMRLKVSSRKPD